LISRERADQTFWYFHGTRVTLAKSVEEQSTASQVWQTTWQDSPQ
jgi:hypothetical protein